MKRERERETDGERTAAAEGVCDGLWFVRLRLLVLVVVVVVAAIVGVTMRIVRQTDGTGVFRNNTLDRSIGCLELLNNNNMVPRLTLISNYIPIPTTR